MWILDCYSVYDYSPDEFRIHLEGDFQLRLEVDRDVGGIGATGIGIEAGSNI